MSDLLKPGQNFAGRYRVDAFLAKGGFGAVYSAEQLDTEARVALKVLWPHLLESEAAVEQFKLEAKISNRIGSEHVIRVYDVGREPESEKAYLAMELLEGKDFEELIQTGGPIHPADVAIYFRQIASALEKAHGYVDRDGEPRPIVHRDLKPENLFLTWRETGDPCVKILDFGLAKVIGESGRTSNEFKGTPLFMSYEQASVGIITVQTDIWALGLIAFYFLTGQSYWLSAVKSDTPVTRIFSEVLSAPMSAPSERAKQLGASIVLTDAFDAWFARAVTRDAAKRFDTVAECVAELLLVLEELESVSPRPRSKAPPDTLTSVLPPATPLSPDVTKTLKSAHPASLAALPSAVPSIPLQPRKGAGVRALGVAGLLAIAGLVVLAARSTGKPVREGAGGAEPRSAPSALAGAGVAEVRPVALPLAAARDVDAGRALPQRETARPAKDSARSASGGSHKSDRSRPMAEAPSGVPAPVTPPPREEDPYESR